MEHRNLRHFGMQLKYYKIYESIHTYYMYLSVTEYILYDVQLKKIIHYLREK
jgi:hypothetical protein